MILPSSSVLAGEVGAVSAGTVCAVAWKQAGLLLNGIY